MNNRVVITGMGAVSPIGIGLTEYENALRAGKSGVDLLTHAEDNDGLDVLIAAEVKNFDPAQHLPATVPAKRMDLSTQYAVAAAGQALQDAGLPRNEKGKLALNNNEDISAIIGTGIGGFGTTQDETWKLLQHQDPRIAPNKVDVLTVPKLMTNAPAGLTSLVYGIQGGSFTLSSACSSANTAMATAYDRLVLGRTTMAVTGGTEAVIRKLTVAAFSKMRALTKQYNDNPRAASRPFDADRSGFVIGEGAGMVVMETLDNAHKRGARIYAEVLGYGSTSDAHHLVAPHPDGKGAARAMRMALTRAGLAPEQVDYINAHGTSTPLNDPIETAAIQTVFGRQAYNLHISSTKSMTGHPLGAAGGLELVATILGMHSDTIYPTINLDNPDPRCDLHYVPHTAISQAHDVALLNSFGFGGHNEVLAIQKWND